MSGSSTDANGTTTTNIDPLFKQDWSKYYDLAQQTAQDYADGKVPMQHVAGQDQDTNRADTVLNTIVNNDAGYDQLHQAQDIAGNVAGYQPQQVQASQLDLSSLLSPLAKPAAQVNGRDVQYITGNASTAPDYKGAEKVTAGNYNGADKTTIDRGSISNIDPGSVLDHLGQYKDPYQRQVVDTTMSDLEHQRQVQRNSDAADAAAAGAFGNSRYGVMQANTNDAYDRNAASTLAQLNSQGFDKATGLSQFDVGNDMTAQGANQAADLSVFGQNATMKQAVNLDNAQQEGAREQFNAGLKQDRNIANAAGQAAQQQFDATQKQGMTLANLGYANTARQQTAQNDQQARVTNAAAENDRRQQLVSSSLAGAQSNQSANLTGQTSNQQASLAGMAQSLDAGQALAAMGQQRQAMGINQVNALNSQGQINQGQSQAQMDATFNNANARDQRDIKALQIAGAPFQLMPGTGQGGTSTTASSGKGIGI